MPNLAELVLLKEGRQCLGICYLILMITIFERGLKIFEAPLDKICKNTNFESTLTLFLSFCQEVSTLGSTWQT